MSEFLKSISENTMVPLGLAIGLIGGGAAWMTNIQVGLAAHQESLQDLKSDSSKVSTSLSEMKSELAIIRVKLENIEGQLKRR